MLERSDLKMETMHGHIVYKTETAAPITVRDHLGASHIVLSHEIYLLMGEPWTEPMSDNSSGGKIQMKRLTLESKATYRFFYKIAGMEGNCSSPGSSPKAPTFTKDIFPPQFLWVDEASRPSRTKHRPRPNRSQQVRGGWCCCGEGVCGGIVEVRLGNRKAM